MFWKFLNFKHDCNFPSEFTVQSNFSSLASFTSITWSSSYQLTAWTSKSQIWLRFNFFPTGGISCKSMWQVRKYVFLNKREIRSQEVHISLKVIYPKYSKHWPYILAYTMDCDWSKMLNHGLNHGLFLSFFNFFVKIHWSALEFWEMNWFRWTPFLVYFELDFYCVCCLQIQVKVRNGPKMELVEIHFSKIKSRSTVIK